MLEEKAGGSPCDYNADCVRFLRCNLLHLADISTPFLQPSHTPLARTEYPIFSLANRLSAGLGINRLGDSRLLAEGWFEGVLLAGMGTGLHYAYTFWAFLSIP